MSTDNEKIANENRSNVKHVFIIGCKGIPAHYGGFETFVDNLVKRQKNKNIKYHVACIDLGGKIDRTEEYYGASRFFVRTPDIHSARAVYYDLKALRKTIEQIEKNNYRDGIVYILACRIGPFVKRYIDKLHSYGFKVYVNPDGHEWLRSKWSKPVRNYWKKSERLMVKNADLLICDSKNIEKYIKEKYAEFNPKTTFIAYGADTEKSKLSDDDKKLADWYKKFRISKGNYYLMVGRFVPENNFETVVSEFMRSTTKKDLVIISDYEGNKFYKQIRRNTGCNLDPRIKFTGTLYDSELVKKIRENCFAYIHGHSVGGTNPSLLEALASSNINILYDCGFNREVATDNGAIYFSKRPGELAEIFNELDKKNDYKKMREVGRKRIDDEYSWDKIVEEYERAW